MTASSPLWLITGCCCNLGRALATRALSHGHRVIARARRPEQLDDLVTAYPETCRSLELDVTKLGAGESCGG